MPRALHLALTASLLTSSTFFAGACSHAPGSNGSTAASTTHLTSATSTLSAQASPGLQPVYNVPLDGLPAIGKATAPVTVVEFSDYECPFCQRGETTMKQLRAKYGDEIRFAFAVHPLPMHPQARPAALAALAAQDQGKFEAMHDALVQHAIATNGQPLGDAAIADAARQAGMSVTTLAADEQAATPMLARADALSARLGIRGTPTVFINGKVIVGAQPLETYEHLIDSELAAAKSAIAGGVRPEDVYKTTTAAGAPTVAEGEGEGDCDGECDRKK